MQIKSAVAIVPCLNEENSAGLVLDGLRMVSKKLKLDLKIIAIDDFSTDGTFSILKKKADIAISLKQKASLAEVVRIGLKEASKLNPDIIIHIDADNQYDPSELEKLINPIINNDAEFVIGDRQVNRLDHMTLSRRLGNMLFTGLVNALTKLKLSDAQSGFRVITYRYAKKITLISSYTYTQEEIIRAKNLGCIIKQVKISFRKRKFGKSRLINSPIIYCIRALIDILRVSMSDK